MMVLCSKNGGKVHGTRPRLARITTRARKKKNSVGIIKEKGRALRGTALSVRSLNSQCLQGGEKTRGEWGEKPESGKV